MPGSAITAGNDFKRAERQRRVFSEMMSKAKDASLSQVNELIEAVFPGYSDRSRTFDERDSYYGKGDAGL